jgi:hypothetical protein
MDEGKAGIKTGVRGRKKDERRLRKLVIKGNR